MDSDTSNSSVEDGSKKSRKKKRGSKAKKSAHRKDGLIECELCDEVFIERWEFNEHFRDKHKTTPPIHVNIVEKTPPSSNVVVVRVTPDVDLGRFVCNVCGQRASNKWGLGRHQLLRHGEDQNQRGFGCEDCDKSFKLKQHLDRHKKMVHEGSDDDDKENEENKWKCAVAECDRSFKYERNLKRHVETVHGSRRAFKCHLCQSDFGRKDHWKRHYRRIHNIVEDIPDIPSPDRDNIEIKIDPEELATTSSKATSTSLTKVPQLEAAKNKTKTRQKRKRPYPEERVNVDSEIDDIPSLQIQQTKTNTIKIKATRKPKLPVQEKVVAETGDTEVQSQSHGLEKEKVNETIEIGNAISTLEETEKSKATAVSFMELAENQELMESNVQEGAEPTLPDVDDNLNQPQNESYEDLFAPLKLESELPPLDLSETSALLDYEDLSGSVEYLDMNAPYDLDLARDISNIIEAITANIQPDKKTEDNTIEALPTSNCEHFRCNGSHQSHHSEPDTNNINNVSMIVEHDYDESFNSDSDSDSDDESQLTPPTSEYQTALVPYSNHSTNSNGNYEDYERNYNAGQSRRECGRNRGGRKTILTPTENANEDGVMNNSQDKNCSIQ